VPTDGQFDQYWRDGLWVRDAQAGWGSSYYSILEQIARLRPSTFADIRLPDDRQEFLDRAEPLKSMINNPEIYDHESRSVKEYIDPITISSVDEYVEKKGYNQFAKLNKEIAASSSGRPKWVASANEVLAQPGAAGIDLQLALAIAVRESGSGGLTSGESIESFSNSGLDFLFTSGKRWAQQGLVPKDWVKGSDFTEGNHTSSDGKGKSAWVPAERMLGFFFAAIGAARLHLEEKVSACYGLGGSESEALIDGLPVLARRIWVAISFTLFPIFIYMISSECQDSLFHILFHYIQNNY